MNILQVGDELNVTIPYEARHIFKRTFRSARWNPDNKVWVLNASSSSMKKLEAIREEVELLEADLDENKAIEELRNLRTSLHADVRDQRNVCSVLEERARLREALMIEIEMRRQELDEIASKVESHREKLASTQDEVRALLNSLTNIPAIYELAMEMLRDWRSMSNRHLFKNKQRKIAELYEPVREAGFRISAIDHVLEANYNRKDRDDFSCRKEEEFWEAVPTSED